MTNKLNSDEIMLHIKVYQQHCRIYKKITDQQKNYRIKRNNIVTNKYENVSHFHVYRTINSRLL